MNAAQKINVQKPIIRTVNYYIYDKKLNCLVGITGRVGTGKSHMGVHVGWLFGKKFDIKKALVYTVEDLVNRSLSYIKFQGKPMGLDMLKSIGNVKEWLRENIHEIYISPGHVVIFDEAGTGAYVREFFSQDNKTISKMVQIWRILRMLVIFIVPEDLSLMDSTISKFLNIEIKMLGINEKKNHAECIAWMYMGWNKKKREPIRRRLRGCRYGGSIKVPPLPEDIALEYEAASKVFKIDALVQMGRQYVIDKPHTIAGTKTIWDDVNYVVENSKKFTSVGGKITAEMVQTILGVSLAKARSISQHAAKRLHEQRISKHISNTSKPLKRRISKGIYPFVPKGEGHD